MTRSQLWTNGTERQQVGTILADIQENWLVYLSIPAIGALIGYTTKLVMVEMLFRPLNFRGIPPFLGWQGIIPRTAPRMATIAVDLILTRLLTPQDLINLIDPRELVAKLEDPIRKVSEDVIRQIMLRYKPGLWEMTPEFAREIFIRRVQSEIPKIVERTANDIRTDIGSVLASIFHGRSGLPLESCGGELISPSRACG